MAGKSHKELSPIYVSLAITYFDLKCPADAINCYMEELEIMEERNYKEVKGSFLLTVLFFFKVNYVCIFLRCNQSIAMTGIQKMYLKQSSLVHQSASQGKSLRVGYGPFRTLIIVFLSREKSTSILT